MLKPKEGEFTGHVDPDNYSYSSARIEYVEGIEEPAVHIYDLTFTAKDSPISTIIDGPVFLAPAAPPYYHMLLDVVGEYELLKSKYPDVKIVFCSNDNFFELNKHRDILRNKFVYEIPDLYGMRNIVLDVKNTNVHFKHVIHFVSRTMWLQDRIVPLAIQDSLGEFDRDLCIKRRVDLIDFIRYKLLPHKKNIDTPEKIYSARIKPSATSDPNNDIRSYADEQKIIEYFENKGFTTVSLDGMSVFEQIALFANAKEIAGISGTNLLNAIFANDDTKLYQIHVTNLWAYELFNDYFNHVSLDLVDVCDDYVKAMNLDGLTHVPIDKVIKELDKLNI